MKNGRDFPARYRVQQKIRFLKVLSWKLVLTVRIE
jgi:hypothetical protein